MKKKDTMQEERMENIEGFLRGAANALGVELFPAQTDAFQKYMKLLLDWNKKMNLTAITEPRDVVIKHFADSLTVLTAVELKRGARVIDVGTGAGFPGIPLRIAREDLQMTLLDSQQKRLDFLQEVCKKIRITADTVHARAEEAGREKAYRMKFDLAVSRAVAPLNVLCEYCMPFVRMGGVFVAMKGPGAQEEIEQAHKAIQELGCELVESKKMMLIDGSQRILVVCQRTKGLSGEYPRHGSKIAKKPL